jgi:hypothetical protein
MFTNTDQDAIAFHLYQNPLFNKSSKFSSILHYDVMNNRMYHYKSSPEEHFILHLAGVPDKAKAMIDLSNQLGCSPLFVPSIFTEQYRFSQLNAVKKTDDHTLSRLTFKIIRKLRKNFIGA